MITFITRLPPSYSALVFITITLAHSVDSSVRVQDGWYEIVRNRIAVQRVRHCPPHHVPTELTLPEGAQLSKNGYDNTERSPAQLIFQTRLSSSAVHSRHFHIP